MLSETTHDNARPLGGLIGWTRYQLVKDMGGDWMRIIEPEPPI